MASKMPRKDRQLGKPFKKPRRRRAKKEEAKPDPEMLHRHSSGMFSGKPC